MRLPEAKIKEAILHPDKLARQEALRYFDDSHSRDPEVMPLAIKAIETFGRAQAFTYFYGWDDLEQTEATVEWAIRELNRESDNDDDYDRYVYALSRLLCNADLRLVQPRAEEIFRAPGFFKEMRADLEERLQLATWDADRCWKELEDFSLAALGAQDSSEVDMDHARRVVEALARRGEPYVDRILDLLSKKIEDLDKDPLVWMEIFLVMLAGEMRLERAVPLVVAKLHVEEAELLWEACIDALGKIGTDAAAGAVAEGFLEADWDYRTYASGALEKIHSDTTVRKCLEFLPAEKDLTIRTGLANALLSQFADEGIEPVREMVKRDAYDSTMIDLKEKLVAVSTVLGATFPEYPIWKRTVEAQREALERRLKKMNGSLRHPPPLPPPVEPDWKPTPIVRTEDPVGRNDPCPCGSGKKFKKCCLNKGT